ncbi:Alpha/Beta hydrolase protein [Scenedesmus sp. NREL 46B-D3]|nr:Alpha/Beta hydrolase protein [Scenedesmus sp. NREL 46B-D3]
MHTLTNSSSSGNEPVQGPAMVLMPGYGAGTGFFFRNLDGLARVFNVFAVDWLGTGLSGRPPFTGRDRASTEDFFLESLNTWRQKQGLDSFILVGHSLGGYLAASYALRHPEQVQHLVLVGPAGIGTAGSAAPGRAGSVQAKPTKPEGWESRFATDSWSLRSQLFKLAAHAWASGVTPFSVIRALGPWGPGLVGKYVTGRFSMHGVPLEPDESSSFRDYFYHIAAARGSGEYALRHILAPGAWAHAPLQERLADLKVPVTVIYGEHDWMQPAAGQALAAKLDQIRPRKVASDHRVEIVPDSGHFVFLEQPQAFNAVLLRSMEPYLPHGLAADAAAREEQALRVKRERLVQQMRERQQTRQPEQQQQQQQQQQPASGRG